jgi:histidinol-phosphatase (PHP family)
MLTFGVERSGTEIYRLTDEYEKVFNGTQDAMFLVQVLEDGSFR